jgi:hypothetical protein
MKAIDLNGLCRVCGESARKCDCHFCMACCRPIVFNEDEKVWEHKQGCTILRQDGEMGVWIWGTPTNQLLCSTPIE